MESMNRYYNERAAEYDDIYSGRGPASIKDPRAYNMDIDEVKSCLASADWKGTVLDLPCGTAYWMDAYAALAGDIILADQSGKMLDEALKRADFLGARERCRIIEADVLSMKPLSPKVDAALVGFLVSHFTPDQETLFFSFLRDSLKPGGRIFLLDSTWSDERAETRNKEGLQQRRLNDGTSFEIYKKYFTREEAVRLGEPEGFKPVLEYFGRTMFLASLSL